MTRKQMMAIIAIAVLAISVPAAAGAKKKAMKHCRMVCKPVVQCPAPFWWHTPCWRPDCECMHRHVYVPSNYCW